MDEGSHLRWESGGVLVVITVRSSDGEEKVAAEEG